MASPGQLPEEYRGKLDSIVTQMEKEGLSDEDIQATVNDFKQKYALPAMMKMPPPPGELNDGIPQNLQSLPPTAEQAAQTLKDFRAGKSVATPDMLSGGTKPTGSTKDLIGQAYTNMADMGNREIPGVQAALPLMAGGAGAEALLPDAAKAAMGRIGTSILKALMSGATTGGIDALEGGTHPVRAGAIGALGYGALEVPGGVAILRKMLPEGAKPIFDLLKAKFGSSAGPMSEVFQPGQLKNVQKFGGSVAPDVSPAAKAKAKKIQDGILNLKDWLEQAKKAKIAGKY